jgi:predicted Kef-type K+ transport protein
MQADIIAIATAFALGMGARLVGLPPLVGYLMAGFVLFSLGAEATPTLQEFSQLGVTLLLFSIGLKLDLGNLLRPQIWAVASLHMLGSVLFLSLFIYLAGFAGLVMFSQLELPLVLLISFALSFSSTVFAVKVLEEKGEMGAFYGQIAIGILIMQDIAAVIFLAFSTGKVPTPWALLLLGLVPLRPLLNRIMERAGHGELLILFGLTLALGGAKVFEFAGIKGDLGALILGLVLAGYPKSSELSRHLLGFKDLFLVGFFLVIGMSGALSLHTLSSGLLLTLLIPAKALFFFWLLTKFRLRARTSFLTSLSLGNYSEFGLIVAAIGVHNQWISGDWLIVIAIALSASFIAGAPLNSSAHRYYAAVRHRLTRLQSSERLPEEQPIEPTDAAVLVFGMGRVGSTAFDRIRSQIGDQVLGIDLDQKSVEESMSAGRRAIRGNATDPDFWNRFCLDHERIRLVLLAMPNQKENLFAARQIRELGYQGRIAAIAKYRDDMEALREAGADMVFNLYAEAGIGLADHVCQGVCAVDLPAPLSDSRSG